jgi:hypothetical protein
MEAAISSGLKAADVLLGKTEGKAAVKILEPPVFPEWLLTLGKLALAPVAILARLATLIRDRA